MVLHFAGIAKESPEFPVSCACACLPEKEFRKVCKVPAPFIVDSAAHTPTQES